MNNFDILKDKIDKLVVIYEECVFPNFSRSDFKKITYFECLLGNITFDECQELDSYIDNLEHYREELNENSRQYSLYTQSIEQLRGLEFQDTISINIELVTTHYHTKELELHKNHSILTNIPQIFLM